MTQDLAVLDQEAERIVKEIGIPPCPAILTKLLREMREDDPDFKKIGSMIGGDVSLAAAMLKTVNSPFYGLRTKATSVQQSLSLLGLRNVAQLVTGLLLKQAFATTDNAAMETFWETSSHLALITAHLARALKVADRDEAYTFGLFRDCGVPLLMQKFKDYPKTMAAAAASAAPRSTDLEEERHKVHHALIGHRLAESWLLAADLCAAIRWHHDFPALADGTAELTPAASKLIALGLAADLLYSFHVGELTCAEWDRGEAFALPLLGVARERLDELAAEVSEMIS